jgi:hypothetical protein
LAADVEDPILREWLELEVLVEEETQLPLVQILVQQELLVKVLLVALDGLGTMFHILAVAAVVRGL